MMRRAWELIVYLVVDRCSPSRRFIRQVAKADPMASFQRGMDRAKPAPGWEAKP